MNLELTNKKYFIFITIISTLLLMSILLMELSNPSLSASIENGSEVEKNSELIYYLNVTYDGIASMFLRKLLIFAAIEFEC